MKDNCTAAYNLLLQKENVQEVKVNSTVAALDNLSPLKTLKRGYFRLSKKGVQINGVKSLDIGDVINARGVDGSVEAKVEKIILQEVDE